MEMLGRCRSDVYIAALSCPEPENEQPVSTRTGISCKYIQVSAVNHLNHSCAKPDPVPNQSQQKGARAIHELDKLPVLKSIAWQR
jgi:hypothetical protein